MDTVECSHCKGTGREVASISLDTGSAKHRTCGVCDGSGKVTVEKSHYTEYPDVSLRNAIQLMQTYGKPAEIHIAGDHDMRIVFKDGSKYMLGGFTVGYKGTGTDYTKLLLDTAGFNVTIDEIAEMKPPITLTTGQAYIAPKTLIFRAHTVEEARKAAIDSVPPSAEITAIEVVSDGTILDKTEHIVYTTFDEASRRAKSILSDRAEFLEEKIEDDAGILARGIANGEGDSEDGAIEKARNRLPQGASITGKEIVQEGKYGTAIVNASACAFNERDARWHIEHNPLSYQAPEGAIVTSVECIREPRSGFMGLGTKPGIYKVFWRLPWQVALTYQCKKLVLTYQRKPTVSVTFQPLSKPADA